MHSIYFALRPDRTAAMEAWMLAEELRRAYGLAGRPIPPERLHISLNSLGRAPSAQAVDKACEEVSRLRLDAFRVDFNRVASFGRAAHRPVVLWGEEGMVGVDRLHLDIHAALSRPGLMRGPPYAFEPHMTLLWDDDGIPEAFVEPLGWTARELVLLDTVRGEGRQLVLARWQLN